MGIGLDLAAAAADEEDRKAGASLRALDAWCRKHYRAAVHLGPSVMPGDEGHVELNAGGRKVVVDFYDIAVWDEGEGEYKNWPSAADLIREALRRWHADDKPKVFRVLVYHEAGFARPEGARAWTDAGTEFTITARNEAEAVAEAQRLVPVGRRSVHAWERGPAPQTGE